MLTKSFKAKPKDILSNVQQNKAWKTLTNCQKRFFKAFDEGHNILLTGAAGVGKSHSLSLLFSVLDECNIPYGKTATTGIAALNIGGSTIHSFCGVGLANDDIGEIMKRVFRNKKATARMRVAKILCIDEISMCSGDLLEKINTVLKIIRKDKSPFGGIQVIFCGDFLQLPAVFKTDDDPLFCFETQTWESANIKTILLEEIVRQDNSSEFAKLLNNIRVGNLDNIEILHSRINKKLDTGELKPIKIFCRNVSVDKYNQVCLDKINSKTYSYQSLDMGESYHIDYFNKNSLAVQNLKIKIGAQVMLIYNIDVENGLVNGSMGIIKAIEDNLPKVEFANGQSIIVEKQSWEIKEQIVVKNREGVEEIKYRTVAKRTQIPLKLAFSSTLHKSQGLTLSYADLDFSDAFESGMVYVGLSRVRDINNLTLKPFNLSKIKVNQKCLDFYENIK